eukprot:5338705-Pyramimonas_sp.AAC.1
MKDQSCPIDLIAFPRLWERLVGLQDASTTEYSGGSELSFKGEMHSNLHLHQEALLYSLTLKLECEFMTARPTLPPVASRSDARHSWARSPSAPHQRMPRECCS